MKGLNFMILILCMVLVVTVANATEKKKPIIVTHYDNKDYIEVKTRTNTLRIYGCGKVDKLSWSEINPNEENVTADTILAIDGSEELQWYSGTAIAEDALQLQFEGGN